MVKNLLVWLFAFLITASIAVYQRMTGPTYPIKGSVVFNEGELNYKFLRSEDVGKDLMVRIESSDTSLNPIVYWKRYKTEDELTATRLIFDSTGFSAFLPTQPAAGKLEYYLEIKSDSATLRIPEDSNVVIRFKGAVPLTVLIFHVIAMFGAMLLSTRTGLEFFRKEPKVKTLTYWTIGFLFVGGLILGPIVQKYAFDAYWTGWPFGHDLTDNKTALALLGWVVALFMYKKSKYPGRWALFASILLLIIYLIPHSVLGSELDYSKIDSTNKSKIIEMGKEE